MDGIWAEFEKDGKTIRVHITAQDLRSFGVASQNDKAAHTETVLRAILGKYCEELGPPRAHINAKDLSSVGLAALKLQFQKTPTKKMEKPSE